MTKLRYARTCAFLLTAAIPGAISAGTIPIGLSTSPVTFTPGAGSVGTISVGTCSMGDCVVNGAYNKSGLDFGWALSSTGTLTYSGGPALFGLAGNSSTFALSDAQNDNISGSVSWNAATEGTLTTDLNGTLTLQAAQFGSATDPLALAAIAYFGALPTSGQSGSLDLVVSCGGPCITTVDPTGQIVASTLTFSPGGGGGSAVPEPGTLVLPGLALGFLLLRRR